MAAGTTESIRFLPPAAARLLFPSKLVMTDLSATLPGLFRQRSFLLFLASRGLSSIAFQGTGVALGWLVYDRTRNPLDLGHRAGHHRRPAGVGRVEVGR